MSLKMYVNGTPGGTDGTEITSLTIKNLMSYSCGSDYSTNSLTVMPIFLRETSGTASSVIIIGKLNYNSPVLYTGSSRAFSAYPTSGFDFSSDNSIGNVGTTNVLVFLCISANTFISSGTELFTISYVEN